MKPETRDPRGRTQAYQALYNQHAEPPREERQLDLLDLLADNAGAFVGGQADNGTAAAEGGFDHEDIVDGEEDA